MKQIAAKIVTDSINPQGRRRTFFLITYPRIIQHKVTSYCRVISSAGITKKIEKDPFIPIVWERETGNKELDEYITDPRVIKFKTRIWLDAFHQALYASKELASNVLDKEEVHEIDKTSVTKYLANKLLEPFMWNLSTVVGTEWEKFFELYCPKYVFPGRSDKVFRSRKDANKHFPENSARNREYIYWLLNLNYSQEEMHMQVLAETMWDAYNSDYNSLPYDEQKNLVIEFHQGIRDNKIKGLYEYIEKHHPADLNISVIERDFTYGEGFRQWLKDRGYTISTELE